MRRKIRGLLESAMKKIGLGEESPIVDYPKNSKFGDYSTNVAMAAAERAGLRPRELAEKIVKQIEHPHIERVEVAGPGFINIRVKKDWWWKGLRKLLIRGPEYGDLTLGKDKRVQIEFVSANPTGPLHIGHGRGAAVGDSLARILKKAGFDVEKEYYVNDAGRQMRILGESIWERCMELSGEEAQFPAQGYKGRYIYELAKEALREFPRLLDKPREEGINFLSQWGGEKILESIRKDLEVFGVKFDSWCWEKKLYQQGFVEESLGILKKKGYLYEKEGALWFKTSELGDEKDRVAIRSTGEPTYLASDIAYHHLKMKRGFHQVVDVWGADHHGYVSRVKAAMEALGHNPERLKVILIQMVSLIKGGEKVSMSTRQGEFIPLSHVIEEVGKDAARFIFLTRKSDAHLDLDIDLAKSKTEENPVFYVQYAHARICSIFRTARERGILLPKWEEVSLKPLILPQELELIKKLSQFPDVIEGIALSLEPHRLTYYLHELVALFHSYYNHHRVLLEEKEKREARMVLAKAVGMVVREGLDLLGVEAPLSM